MKQRKQDLVINIGAVALLVSEITLGILSMMGIVNFVWTYVLLIAFAIAGTIYTQNEFKQPAKQK